MKNFFQIHKKRLVSYKKWRMNYNPPSLLDPTALGTIGCLLCRSVVSYTEVDHRWYEEHLTVEHKILFYIPWIIVKTEEVVAAAVGDVKRDSIAALVEPFEENTSSSASETVINNEEQQDFDPVIVKEEEIYVDDDDDETNEDNHRLVETSLLVDSSSDMCEEEEFGYYNGDEEEFVDNYLDSDASITSIVLPDKDVEMMDKEELINHFLANNFKVPVKNVNKNMIHTKERLRVALKLKLIDAVTGIISNEAIREYTLRTTNNKPPQAFNKGDDEQHIFIL